jgi:hypothetical protein
VIDRGQEIKMTRNPVTNRIGIQSFGKKDEVPFLLASLIDDVLPCLRRQALREVGADTVKLVARPVKPIGEEVGKVIPDVYNLEIIAASGIKIGLEEITFILSAAATRVLA